MTTTQKLSYELQKEARSWNVSYSMCDNYGEVIELRQQYKEEASAELLDIAPDSPADIPQELYLSPNQIQFIEDGNEQGLDFRWYSGRGMDGDFAPAFTYDSWEGRFKSKTDCTEDTMGKNIIVYARR